MEGNQKKMREALQKIREKCVIYNNALAEEIDALCGNALDAPPRNCDRFDSWHDAHKEWEHLPKDELGYWVDANGVRNCEQAWLFALSTGQKGK